MSLISQEFGTRRRGVAEKGEVQLIVETRHCLVSTALFLFSLKFKQKTNTTLELIPLHNQVETPNLGVSTANFHDVETRHCVTLRAVSTALFFLSAIKIIQQNKAITENPAKVKL